MNKRRFFLIPTGLAILLLASFPSQAAQMRHPAAWPENGKELQQPEVEPGKQPERKKEAPEERLATTSHAAMIGGTRIQYTATAGTFLLKDEDGEARASIFFIAYNREGVADRTARPLTFAFNGGPGSSSVWLHLGALGPRRIELADGELKTQAPPYSLVNNEHSLLDLTDLVFIDPVSTGYSRAVPEEEAKEFHGVDKDIASIGDFIRLYLTRFNRWSSPRLLIGESYGSTRAAGLAGYLQERHGIYLNGLALVSVVLDFQTISFDPGNDLPYVLYLPAYTATAWYHRRLPEDLSGDLETALAAAERFARGDYARALLLGTALTAAEREEVVGQLARFTGLSPEFLRRSDLRVPVSRFAKELLRDRRLTIGRFDSRFTGLDQDATGAAMQYDPSYTSILGIFTASLNDYVRTDLKFEEDLPYEVLNASRVQPWDFNRYKNRYLAMTDDLREAMIRQPGMRVLFANGYFDLATPYAATRYTLEHLGLEPDLRPNTRAAFYEAGHMMYVHGPSLAKFKKDLGAFYGEAVP